MSESKGQNAEPDNQDTCGKPYQSRAVRRPPDEMRNITSFHLGSLQVIKKEGGREGGRETTGPRLDECSLEGGRIKERGEMRAGWQRQRGEESKSVAFTTVEKVRRRLPGANDGEEM